MEQRQKIGPSKFYRFQLFQGEIGEESKLERSKTVGMAYLKEGQNTYTIRLWTFVDDRFYLIQNRNDPSKYILLTREVNKNPNAKSKFIWNIVGNGQCETNFGVIKLQFDLFHGPIYMSVFPEAAATTSSLPNPEEIDRAA